MYHVITATAAYASHILGLCISGTVHSVYKKTINIQLGPVSYTHLGSERRHP